MSDPGSPETIDQWVKDKRLKVQCKYHPEIWHDPKIQCPSCRKEDEDKHIQLSKQGREALNSIFEADKSIDRKKRWSWLWLLPSVALVPLAIYLTSQSTPWLSIIAASTAAILAGVGISQLLADHIKWWVMLLIFIGVRLFIAMPMKLEYRWQSIILDFVSLAILTCVIGIPIVNSHRKRN